MLLALISGHSYQHFLHIFAVVESFPRRAPIFLLTPHIISILRGIMELLLWHRTDCGYSKKNGPLTNSKISLPGTLRKLCIVREVQQTTWESLHLMDSTVDRTFVTEGFSGAICKSERSSKMLCDLLIMNCANYIVPSTRFQQSPRVALCKKTSGRGAMRFLI